MRDRVAACLATEGIFGKKRWPAEREMKVLIGGEDVEQRTFRRSLLKPHLEKIMAELGQAWSFTDDVEDADAYLVLTRNGKPASAFTRSILLALYKGDQEKVANAIPDVEDWPDEIDMRMNMDTNIRFRIDLSNETKDDEKVPTFDVTEIFSTSKRLVMLKASSDTPNSNFARIGAFTAIIGLEATGALAGCDGYSGFLSEGKGPSRQHRIVLELIE